MTTRLPTEADPLCPGERNDQPGAGPSTEQRDLFRWRCLLFLLGIVTLERCTYYNFMSMAVNAGNSNDQFCGALRGEDPADPSFGTVFVNRVLHQCLSFLLTPIGGYVADSFCGCVKTLACGCVMYQLGAWLLVAFVHWPVACNPALVFICKMLVAGASGLLRPCLFALTIESGLWRGFSVRHVCQLYYVCESLSQLLGNLLAYGSDKLEFPLGFVCVPTTIAMCLLATQVGERPDWNPSQFVPPGWPRFKRVITTSAPLVILSISVLAGYFSLSVSDLYGNVQQVESGRLRTSHVFLLLCYSATLVLAAAVLMLTTRASGSVRSFPDIRIAIGVAASALGHLMALSTASIPRSIAVWVVAIVQNLFYSIGEAFAISTANEVAFRSGFAESRTFMVGVFMGIWGSGYLFNAILVFYAPAVILHFVFGVLSLLTILYLYVSAVPAMYWLLGRSPGLME